MTRIATAVCLALLLATSLGAQGKSAASAGAAPGAADAASVDSILSALYASVSHGPDAEPDWDRLRAITLPVGMFIPPKKPTDDIFTVLDVDAFQERVRKGAAAMKAKGESTAFSEHEVSRHTDCFGNVCQIFSTYEGRRLPADEKPFVRGINSIQLLRDGRRWWIASVVWDTERPDNPIPAEYQKAGVPAEYLKKN
ncbi:MAG TPA: hypothetical protein VGK26_04000 [Thermoanaerobaculia bacterium]